MANDLNSENNTVIETEHHSVTEEQTIRIRAASKGNGLTSLLAGVVAIILGFVLLGSCLSSLFSSRLLVLQ